jgi:hypothetical protein
MSPKRIPRVPPPPENPGVEILYRVSESLKRMTDDELFALGVRAGVYTADGRLTKKYGGTADPEEAAAA